ncbi:MAG: BlaI/MecI/CopY family transcriptional regulator [Pirellulales bacterium]
MGESLSTISDAELEVLKALWKHGPATVREINAQLRPLKRRWAYNTVLTLLTRLREKGYVASEKRGVAHRFASVVSREELLRRKLTDVADRVCNGMASPLVHALVEGQQFSADEIAQFRKLFDELQQAE